MTTTPTAADEMSAVDVFEVRKHFDAWAADWYKGRKVPDGAWVGYHAAYQALAARLCEVERQMAADAEIDGLRQAELDRLMAESERLTKELATMNQEYELATRQRDNANHGWELTIKAYEDTSKLVDAVRAQRDALAAALEPFSAYAGKCSTQDDDDLRINLEHPDHIRSSFVSVGDFRRARTALTAPPPPNRRSR